jgi:hypothetical protein
VLDRLRRDGLLTPLRCSPWEQVLVKRLGADRRPYPCILGTLTKARLNGSAAKMEAAAATMLDASSASVMNLQLCCRERLTRLPATKRPC